MQSTNPYTTDVLDSYERPTDDEVDAAVERAIDRFPEWADRSVQDRCEIVDRAGDLLES